MKHTYANLFIELGKYTAFTAVVVAGFITTAAIASSSGIKSLKHGPVVAENIQLAIKAPKVKLCPASAVMNGWIRTSKPGPISYRIVKKDGQLSGPYTLQAVKSINGGMANFTKKFPVNAAVDTQYRVLISGTQGVVTSKWVSLKANCSISATG